MTSWRKFKKKYKKDAAKCIYGHAVTFTGDDGNSWKGTMKGFTPRLETKLNGKKRVVWNMLVDKLSEVVASKCVYEAERNIDRTDGSLSIVFTVKSENISQTIKDMIGL